MIQKQFALRAAEIVKHNPSLIGLTIGGSWLSAEVDKYSDLDLILVTHEKLSNNKPRIFEIAGKLGKLLSAFTGEHVGESRLLICLYDDPLLHVDIKFLTLEEFQSRVETPVILTDTDDILLNTLKTTKSKFPYPDYQWIEDRFWIWIHYALLKIGRGEYFEALDFLSYLRGTVLGPLLHIKNGHQPRGIRRVETKLPTADLDILKSTIATHDRDSILQALENIIILYKRLRSELFDQTKVSFQSATELAVMQYKSEIVSSLIP